jgi:hypothetical protein
MRRELDDATITRIAGDVRDQGGHEVAGRAGVLLHGRPSPAPPVDARSTHGPALLGPGLEQRNPRAAGPTVPATPSG